MATPEGKVKRLIDRRMKDWFPEAVRYAPPGVGMFGLNGMPDRMWTIKATNVTSIVVCIEAKAANGVLTDLQLNRLKKYAKQGAVCAVVTGEDENHLRRIRDEVLRRIRLANEKSESSAVQASD